jgi:hypothetical protein
MKSSPKNYSVYLILLSFAVAALSCRAAQVGLTGIGDAIGSAPKEALLTIPFEYVEVDGSVSGDVKLVGDIDGDSLPDLIIGGMPGEKLNWYRNPTWTKTVIATPSNEFTTDGALGDVDGDGDLDIIVPDGDSGDNLVWFANPRPGGDPSVGSQWVRHAIGPVNGWGKDVKPADYDKDGRLDVATRNNNEVMIFFQTTANTWSKQVFSGVSAGYEGMASGDIDKDTETDLVLQGVWLRNPGGAAARTPGSWSQHTIGSAPGNFKALVVDLNQDGKVDVLFSSSEDTADVDWWTPSGSDPTGAWTKHTIVNSLEKAHTLQAADMDLDGDLDVVLAQMHTSSATEIMVMENTDGQATAWQKQVVDTGGIHNGVVADVDDDGDFDIYGANWTGNPPVKLWINHLETISRWTYIQVSSAHEQTFGLAFPDIDGDGKKDIASGRYWYRNPGGDMTGAWTQLPLPDGMHAALTLDVDGDALVDLVAHKDETDIALYWLEVTSSAGSAWNSVKIGTLPQASHALGAQGYRVGQVEAGGKEEVLFSSGAGIYYFRVPASPAGGSWPRVYVNANPSDEGFALGDIDRDGDLDIAATTGDSKRVEWYRNPGNGSENWQAFHIGSFDEALFPDRTEVADVNKDGRLDILVTEENGGDADAEIFWWEAPADPTSANWTRHLITSQATTNSMDVADMDADGDTDVILAEHRGTKKLSIWYNDGSGGLVEVPVSSGKESHLGARTVDLDGDGDRDIVSIAWDESQFVHLWRNDGQGSVPPPPTPTPVPTATPPPGGGTRVTNGLQALYTFAENGGSVIGDVSGVGSPLNLQIGSPGAVSWINGGGLAINASASIIAQSDETKIVSACKASNELTLEAWIKPANSTQDGPARIVTFSLDSLSRNFTLGQEFSAYDVRLRTTTTSDNGVPSLATSSGAVNTQLTHVVFTRATSGVTKIYVNGGEATSGNTGGDFSGWDAGHTLALANELSGDRPWLGEYQLAAIYCRGLSAAEVQQNYLAGPRPSTAQLEPMLYLPAVIKSLYDANANSQAAPPAVDAPVVQPPALEPGWLEEAPAPQNPAVLWDVLLAALGAIVLIYLIYRVKWNR